MTDVEACSDGDGMPDWDDYSGEELCRPVIVIDEYGTAITCQCGAYKQPTDPCPRCGR